MSAVAKLHPEPGTDIVAAVTENPSLVLTDQPAFDAFYSAIEQKVRDHKPDLTTDKGRKAIASLAREVSSRKVEIDKAGLKLTEDMRKQIGTVNEARKAISSKFDALRDEARKPLTDWENAEEVRKTARDRDMQELADLATISVTTTAAQIEARIATLDAWEISAETFQEYAEAAQARRENALHTLRIDLERVRQAEKDRAELEELRQLKAQREEEEAARVAAVEKAAADKAEAERLERVRIEREELEAEAAREEEARRAAAAEAARVEAEEAAAQALKDQQEAAAAEQRRRDEAHAAELRRIQEEHEAAERKRQQDEADRLAAEEKRAKNVAHRSKVMREAKEAIMAAAGVEEAQAKAIVKAIADGTVPSVTLTF